MPMWYSQRSRLLLLFQLGLSLAAFVPTAWAQSDQNVVRWWHHPADAENVKAVMHDVARRYEAANPGVKVEITWYQKKEMWPALRSAILARQAPDLFYYDTDVPEFIDGGYLADLSVGVNWDRIQPWSKQFWTKLGPNGRTGTWALPIDASTEELYYNKKLLSELGIQVPASGQLSQDEFLELVRKCVAAGKSAFAVGVGDRPYPGAYVTNYLLLHKLGEEDLKDLWSGGGRVTWNDSRVQDVLKFHKQLIDMKAYPASVSSLKLGEAHRYFHTEQRACVMPVGSWYTFRAFLPPESGGQPKDFQLGMMNYPAMKDGKGNDLKFISIGVSLAVNANSKNLDQVRKLLNVVATPETGAMWM